MFHLLTNKLLRLNLLVVIALSITACGFHLRGNIPLPSNIQNMYVQAPEGTFKDALIEVLEKAGATNAATIESSDVIVNVSEVNFSREVGTLDERGKVDSYSLQVRVRYVLADTSEKIIKEPTSLAEFRQYDFNPEQVLETESEEEQLRAAMEEEIALRMVRQLSRVNYPVQE